MPIGWLKRRRRRRILSDAFPRTWDRHLERNFGHLDQLNEKELQALRQIVQIMLAEKRWEAAQGFAIDDMHKVTVAANAALMLVGMPHDYYRNVSSIIIYPHAISEIDIHYDDGVIERASALGMAYTDGPVILSWQDALRGSINNRDGGNVIIHEFAHKLDMLDDIVNGTPTLATVEECERWANVMNEALALLRRQIERGEAGVLDEYGAIDEGEFFAVASECFFERAVRLKKEHPNVYDCFSAFYGQDPANWKERQS